VDIAMFDSFLLQHFAGDLLERGIYAGLGCDLFGGFVEF